MKFSALIAGLLTTTASAYKPVLVLHGIDGDANQYTNFVADLIEEHPGTNAQALKVFEGTPTSWVQLNYQVEHIASSINDIVSASPDEFKDGYHLVCHSQGALICRCLTEYIGTHQIDTLVSMAGPQMGVYDEAFFSFFPDSIGKLTLEEIYHVAYTSVFQDTLSVANMWSDPNHVKDYLSDNNFLPKYNNLIDHDKKDEFKQNFLSLSKAVFVVGSQADGVTYDGGIGPWQAAVFDYYDTDGETFVDMKNQTIYTEDTFGLKTMDERGDLILGVVEGVSHNEWFNNPDVYKKYVFPHCT
ncbi:hypothetical protein TrST_g9273 [Triparma strigata]|uniref:palmitoyl-CoA hydrolase n=1 Tax=Triparma strigata TaxID=1606541 RepID=A0A9W7E2Y2_9STRA|nr:hypothetical protein TrST_g9273 [Triparma strigata]